MTLQKIPPPSIVLNQWEHFTVIGWDVGRRVKLGLWDWSVKSHTSIQPSERAMNITLQYHTKAAKDKSNTKSILPKRDPKNTHRHYNLFWIAVSFLFSLSTNSTRDPK